MEILSNGFASDNLKVFDDNGNDITGDLLITKMQINLFPGENIKVIMECLVKKIRFSKINLSSLIDMETKIDVIHSRFNAAQMKKHGFSRIN